MLACWCRIVKGGPIFGRPVERAKRAIAYPKNATFISSICNSPQPSTPPLPNPILYTSIGIEYLCFPLLYPPFIAALANGASIADAAAEAKVHRNTIGNWRRSSAVFRTAFSEAQYDRALLVREQADALAGTAVETIRAILLDPKVAPSVRLKAALAILKQASAPPPEAPQAPLPATPKIVHNHAQPIATATVRVQPRIGRNEPCPCGSGRKYKLCCLNRPKPKPLAGIGLHEFQAGSK